MSGPSSSTGFENSAVKESQWSTSSTGSFKASAVSSSQKAATSTGYSAQEQQKPEKPVLPVMAQTNQQQGNLSQQKSAQAISSQDKDNVKDQQMSDS